MGSLEQDARREKVHRLEKQGPGRGTNLPVQMGAVEGNCCAGGRGNKRCRFRLDVRKNLPWSQQAGEPPPLGVKDVLKHSG